MNDFEIKIMKILWEASGPVSEAQLSDAVFDNGVASVLEGLIRLGYIKRSIQDGQRLYATMVSRADYGLQLAEQHAQTFYGGDRVAFIQELVGRTDPVERESLRKLLNETDVT